MRTWVLALVIGCGGSKPVAEPPPPPPPAHTCATAAGHMIDMLPATANSTPENVKVLKDQIVAHCTNDKWSPDAIACIDGAKTPDDVAKCDEMLTPEQHAALAKDSD